MDLRLWRRGALLCVLLFAFLGASVAATAGTAAAGERVPQCSDGADNDGDKLVDRDDPGCYDDKGHYNPNDDDERDSTKPPQCRDGEDNDGDKLVDHPEDPGCDDPDDDDEREQCKDGKDNDGDGATDFPEAGCDSPEDNDERNECSDDVDNADPEDELADEADPGCHTDGDPNNPGSYDPHDDDETDEDNGDGRWTCRASVIRVESTQLAPLIGNPFEPIVANRPEDPCREDDGGVDEIQIAGQPGQPGGITLHVVHASTDDDPASAHASVQEVRIFQNTATGQTQVLRAAALHSTARGSCDAAGNPRLEGDSDVGALAIGTSGGEVPPGHQDIPLGGLGTIHLNETINPDGNRLAQRALFWDNSPLGDIIVAEAVADYHGNPC